MRACGGLICDGVFERVGGEACIFGVREFWVVWGLGT